MFVMSVPTYRELNLPRTNRNDIDTNVEPRGCGSNYVDSVAFSVAPKKKRNSNREIQQHCIGYSHASAILRKDSRPRSQDSRAEFLTTARILSLAGQLVAGISREEDRFFVSATVSSARYISIASYPFASPFSMPLHFLRRLSSRSFPPIPQTSTICTFPAL